MHAVRLPARVDRDAAVSLALCVVVVDVVARREKLPVVQLVVLGLGLLDADDVGVLPVHPVEEALAGGGTNAVGVQRDDAHGVRGVGGGLELRASIANFWHTKVGAQGVHGRKRR